MERNWPIWSRTKKYGRRKQVSGTISLSTPTKQTLLRLSMDFMVSLLVGAHIKAPYSAFRFATSSVGKVFRCPSMTYTSCVIYILKALREEAKQILLFLRSVRTVEVHEIAENGVVSDLLQVRIQEIPTDQLPQKKSDFQRKLETTFENQSFRISGPIELTVRVQVVVVDNINYSNCSQSEWLVASQVGSRSRDVHKVAEALKVLPWVGIALEINSLAATASGGRVFCVLPMPHDVSCHLAVHVNATFSLNDERRELKWTGIERTNDSQVE